jgi:cytoskeletal protein CcmA (bactofilin family)
MLGFLQLFRSKEPNSQHPALSIVGDDTTIRGDTIEGSEDLRIEGTIRADVVGGGKVMVAPDGAVHGTVQAESILVAGTVRGELHAEEQLVLEASSDVEARLQSDALTIESGADFKGTVHDEAMVLADESPSGDHLPAPGDDVVAGEADGPTEDEFVPAWNED